MSKRPVRTTLSDKALNVIGIPTNLRAKNIEDFETWDMPPLEEVKEFVSTLLKDIDGLIANSKGLFLYGSNGVGKTFIASCIAKEAYRYRYSVKRVSFADYVQRYTRIWDAKGIEQREELEGELYTEYKAVELLVIEEIGKEIDSKIAAPVLEDLLRYREDNRLTTVVCTNLDIEQVAERYGQSIVSLIQGNMTPVKIEGRDKRADFYKKRGE